jgi:hypothetical protein
MFSPLNLFFPRLLAIFPPALQHVRFLVFTELSFQAVIVRPLSAVNALVRFAEEPQMFAFEFNDGCPIHVSMHAGLYPITRNTI